MTWFLFTIISPVLNALANYVDKYLVDKVVKRRGIGSIVIFASLMGLPVALLIAIFGPNVFTIQTTNALLIILNGTFYVAWMLPYFYALEDEDASVVAPLFQMSSVVSLVLAFFILGETLGPAQIIGCLLILAGGVGLSVEKSPAGKVKVKLRTLTLLGLSCLFIGLAGVIFKVVAVEEDFWVTSFWENVGIFLSSLGLLAVSTYRNSFTGVLKTNGLKAVGLITANEIIVMVARVTLNYAVLLAPVAMVYFVAEGFQPFFVLAYGMLLSIFLPKFTSENINRQKVIQKLVAICVMFAGTYLINF